MVISLPSSLIRKNPQELLVSMPRCQESGVDDLGTPDVSYSTGQREMEDEDVGMDGFRIDFVPFNKMLPKFPKNKNSWETFGPSKFRKKNLKI